MFEAASFSRCSGDGGLRGPRRASDVQNLREGEGPSRLPDGETDNAPVGCKAAIRFSPPFFLQGTADPERALVVARLV